MNGTPVISEAEYQVMQIIWAADAPISTNEVVRKLEQTTAWKPKTIGTLLSRLVKKGALKYEKDSRVYVYTPLIQQSEMLEMESDSFLNRFYDGAPNALIVNLLQRDKLSEDDMHRLKHILEQMLSERR